MGSFFGGLLSERNEVVLVGRRDHMVAIRAHGLKITGKTVRLARPRVATRIPSGLRPELVLVATKAYDTARAMVALRRFSRRAIFLTLQNGLDNPEIIARTAERVVAGTTAHGVTYVGPGEIRHAGLGDTVIGGWRGVRDADLVRLRDLFEDAGIPTKISRDIRTDLWAKLVVNAAINPVAALAGVPNGRLVRDKRLFTLVREVCREAVSVARAEGVNLDPEDMVHRTALIARRTAGNRSSMLQDLERHRPTEIDAITGAVLRAAARHGLEVPRNEALHALVKAREAA